MNRLKKENRTASVKAEHKHSQGRTVFIAVAIVILTAFIGAAAYIVPAIRAKAPRRALIIVPENGSAQQLCDSIERRYGREFASRFMRATRLTGFQFSPQPGAYEIKSGESAMSAARKIAKGEQYVVTITLRNIRTIEELAGKTSATLRFKQQELIDALSDPDAMRVYGLTPSNALALFMAGKYEIPWDTSAEDFISSIGKNYLAFWNQKRRKQASALGLTPAETATIATIADEETGKDDEKGRVCRLYLNRLKKGMRLQADPTVKYAIGDFSIRRVLKNHLAVQSPYNTYRVSGLPPGPIRISNPSTIDAFLNSEPTADIYMCARPDFSGYHDFSSDFSEHQRNARRYQEKLNELEIR